MPHAEIAGGQWYHEDSGGDGPPIIFSHDEGADHTQFTHQAAKLSDVYRVITWDRTSTVGVRTTARPSQAASDDSSVRSSERLFDLLDLLGIERAVLGGRGQGAELSLWSALQHPDRVRALVLVDPPASPHAGLDDRVPELAMPVLLVDGSVPSEPHARMRRIAADLSDCRGVVHVADGSGPDTGDAHGLDHAIRAFLESLPA